MEENPDDRRVTLLLAEVTTQRLIDGLAREFAKAQDRTTAEVTELRTVLMGSKLSKDSGILPNLTRRVSNLEKTVVGILVILIAALVGNPKGLMTVLSKALAVVGVTL